MSSQPERRRWTEQRSPWEGRQAVSLGDLLWQGHDLAINLVVFWHYRLRRAERAMKPMDAVLANQALRFAKGFVTSFEHWLRASHPAARESMTAPRLAQPGPLSNEGTDHASASSSGADGK